MQTDPPTNDAAHGPEPAAPRDRWLESLTEFVEHPNLERPLPQRDPCCEDPECPRGEAERRANVILAALLAAREQLRLLAGMVAGPDGQDCRSVDDGCQRCQWLKNVHARAAEALLAMWQWSDDHDQRTARIDAENLLREVDRRMGPPPRRTRFTAERIYRDGTPFGRAPS